MSSDFSSVAPETQFLATFQCPQVFFPVCHTYNFLWWPFTVTATPTTWLRSLCSGWWKLGLSMNPLYVMIYCSGFLNMWLVTGCVKDVAPCRQTAGLGIQNFTIKRRTEKKVRFYKLNLKSKGTFVTTTGMFPFVYQDCFVCIFHVPSWLYHSIWR